MYRTFYCNKCHETRQILRREGTELYIICARCGTRIKTVTNEELIFENENESSLIYNIQQNPEADKIKIIKIPENESRRIIEIYKEEYTKIQKIFKENYERILEESKREYEKIRNLGIKNHNSTNSLLKSYTKKEQFNDTRSF